MNNPLGKDTLGRGGGEEEKGKKRRKKKKTSREIQLS